MVQCHVDVAVLRVVIAADVVSDPRIFWRIGGPGDAAIARRFGKRAFAQLNDKRVASGWIGRVVSVGCCLGDAKLYMRRVKLGAATAAHRHGPHAANGVDDVASRLAAERDKVGHECRLIFQADDLHLDRRSVGLHPERDSRLQTQNA